MNLLTWMTGDAEVTTVVQLSEQIDGSSIPSAALRADVIHLCTVIPWLTYSEGTGLWFVEWTMNDAVEEWKAQQEKQRKEQREKLFGGCCVAEEDVKGSYWNCEMKDIGLNKWFTCHVHFDFDGQQEEVFINDDDESTGKYLYFSEVGPQMLALHDEKGTDTPEWKLLTLADTTTLTAQWKGNDIIVLGELCL